MLNNSNFRHRKSIRFPYFDYSSPGYYFITICTKNMGCVFGDINNYSMCLNKMGQIIKRCWLEIPKHYPDVCLDEWIIMPNHLHGIFEITGDNLVTPRYAVGVQNFVPLRNKRQHIIPRSVGCIIRGFKTGVTKLSQQNNIYFKWQRNYYECIIRNEKELEQIRYYIGNNPYNWENDRNNQ